MESSQLAFQGLKYYRHGLKITTILIIPFFFGGLIAVSASVSTWSFTPLGIYVGLLAVMSYPLWAYSKAFQFFYESYYDGIYRVVSVLSKIEAIATIIVFPLIGYWVSTIKLPRSPYGIDESYLFYESLNSTILGLGTIGYVIGLIISLLYASAYFTLSSDTGASWFKVVGVLVVLTVVLRLFTNFGALILAIVTLIASWLAVEEAENKIEDSIIGSYQGS
ncbi:hypothetical protein ACSU1N_06945 [Thermogladius sp. 4427co]|uniref:hypothetical protein n=1 Tax=Thermogladius sp. 4427co TaxID=3450718 RepID=UPI003F7ADD1C